jgi:hypothetical protein
VAQSWPRKWLTSCRGQHRAAGLDAALREELEGAGGARVTVRLGELFERLVSHRNREVGHGATGQRLGDFYDRMGRTLLLGTAELLGRLDVLERLDVAAAALGLLVFVGDGRVEPHPFTVRASSRRLLKLLELLPRVLLRERDGVMVGDDLLALST